MVRDRASIHVSGRDRASSSQAANSLSGMYCSHSPGCKSNSEQTASITSCPGTYARSFQSLYAVSCASPVFFQNLYRLVISGLLEAITSFKVLTIAITLLSFLSLPFQHTRKTVYSRKEAQGLAKNGKAHLLQTGRLLVYQHIPLLHGAASFMILARSLAYTPVIHLRVGEL
ncbi:MAG TPA: hypothetical protein V6D33_05560 [Cyanophyceae cyanobacterium]